VRRRLAQSIRERRDRGSAADTETETSGAETSAAARRRSRRCFVYAHGTIADRGSHVTSAMTTESPLCVCVGAGISRGETQQSATIDAAPAASITNTINGRTSTASAAVSDCGAARHASLSSGALCVTDERTRPPAE